MRTDVWKTWPTPTEGQTMGAWHDGRCAMCGSDIDRLVLDHCHDSGMTRGYLCSRCNQDEGIGFTKRWDRWREGDNPAAVYGWSEVYVNIFGQTPLRPAPLTDEQLESLARLAHKDTELGRILERFAHPPAPYPDSTA